MSKVFVWDVRLEDAMSAARGVGRYISLLQESLPHAIYTNHRNIAQSIRKEDFYVNPFVHFGGNVHWRDVFIHTPHKIAVIHDLIPYIYPTHFPVGIKGAIKNILQKQLLPQYESIVTDSIVSKQALFLNMQIKQSRLHVIYPYAKACVSSIPIYERADFVYVGDATWNKNIVNMLHAFLLTPYKLHLVGKVFATRHDVNNRWNTEIIKAQAVLHAHPDKFIVHGFVSDEKLVRLYSSVMGNVFVSYEEGFGFSYLEAAQYGTPSILADTPIFHETSRGMGVVFVNPHHVESIAHGIVTIAHTYTQLQNAAMERAKVFNTNTFRTQWNTILWKL